MTKISVLNALYNSNLSHRAVSVARYLLDKANKELTCFPSIKTIAKDLKLSTRTVQRALSDLVDAGYIKKEERFRENGGQSSNLFSFITDEKQEQKMNDKNTRNEQPVNESKCEYENNQDINKTDIEKFDYIDFSSYIRDEIKEPSESKSADNNCDDIEHLADCSNKPYNISTINDAEYDKNDYNRTNIDNNKHDIGVKSRISNTTNLDMLHQKYYTSIICHRGYDIMYPP